jgi:hypothetical protein
MVTPTWLARRMTMPCVILRREPNGTDEYGNVVYDSTPAMTTTCFLSPSSQDELQDGRLGVGMFTIYLHAEVSSVIDTFTAYEIDGAIYEAVGTAGRYSGFGGGYAGTSGGIHHVELLLRRATA